MPSTLKPRRQWRGEERKLLSLGLETVAILGIWLGLGYAANVYLGWHPYGMLAGGVIGVLHVLWRLIRSGKEM
ncbi:MAG: hypothetical protein NZ611_02835 [Bacteroidia bacterium]|nr:hypothetical protein [Bacteroidia bacterium]